jgi:hypothetical protein
MAKHELADAEADLKRAQDEAAQATQAKNDDKWQGRRGNGSVAAQVHRA